MIPIRQSRNRLWHTLLMAVMLLSLPSLSEATEQLQFRPLFPPLAKPASIEISAPIHDSKQRLASIWSLPGYNRLNCGLRGPLGMATLFPEQLEQHPSSFSVELDSKLSVTTHALWIQISSHAAQPDWHPPMPGLRDLRQQQLQHEQQQRLSSKMADDAYFFGYAINGDALD